MSDETTQNAAPELSAEDIAAAAGVSRHAVQTPPDPAKVALHRRVSNDFAAHPPKTPEAKQLFDEIAAQCEGLAHYLIEVCPVGRESCPWRSPTWSRRRRRHRCGRLPPGRLRFMPVVA